MEINRRDFLKCGGGGLAALVVGSAIPGGLENPAYAAVQALTVNLVVTDAMKRMATHNRGVLPDGTIVGPGNPALCYLWIFQSTSPALPPDSPGPVIFATTGDTVTVNVTNDLDEPHAFAIPSLGVTTGPISPGARGTVTFTAGPAGTYLYYDNLNGPVNRVMGLHGAFIVMPRNPVPGHKFTPYDNPTPNIQLLFDDLGTAPWWPGLAWEEQDRATDTPPFRQYIWLLHQASPNLFEEVGNFPPGREYPARRFRRKFLKDPFNPIHDPFRPRLANNIAQYFTINGQAGFFTHDSPYIAPFNRVGEPVIIRVLNAGLWLHSLHIHANHVFTLTRNNQTDPFPGDEDNPIWVDVYSIDPLETFDWLVPYMRPPDVPNDQGIGRDDLQESLDVTQSAEKLGGFGIANPQGPPPFQKADIPAALARTTWPPLQELEMHIPKVGQLFGKATDGVTDIDLGVRLSPLCYPMHDHSEPTQTSQGGNYNAGMVSGIFFTGDRKGARPGGRGVITFPLKPTAEENRVAHGPRMLPGRSGLREPARRFKIPALP